MAVFKIPKKVCKEITDAMSSFWCGTLKSRRGCIGLHGGECAYPNAKGVWAFVIFMPLILLCLSNGERRRRARVGSGHGVMCDAIGAARRRAWRRWCRNRAGEARELQGRAE